MFSGKSLELISISFSQNYHNDINLRITKVRNDEYLTFIQFNVN